ncbi:hypothetical protein [Flagellimonas allohymeniacidonis]|uniref:Peptidoglycan-binding protein LysM n=1 Tax=Flagellimonas allohymeniacidonis TaxID=2517819 RepID=A0A4Q8QIK4_9FLAO|nr:hypothetical protein [Allomuricauda hymeniacidonis]TAI49088.1 hypothetical protein EW142_04650 [Allomuricauda hymeniacidonis]
MKRWTSFALHLAMIVVFTSFGSFSVTKKESPKVPESLRVTLELEPIVLQQQKTPVEEIAVNPPFLGKSFNGFKEALAFKESQGRYHIVNTLGYLGKYQFGKNTLRLMGVYDIQGFLQDAALQEKMFEINVARNKWILRRDIKRFNGKRIRGIEITESGILAAAHLAGAGNVKKYLRSYGKNDVADAYGTTISKYMKKFAGYDVSEILQKRNAKV